MTPADRAARLIELFQAALQIAPPEREAWLSESCADDDELHRELEAMLAADNAECAWLDDDEVVSASAASRAAGALAASDGAEGAVIAGFQLGPELGHGGMGTVYEAWQDHPRRRVALKIMRAGILGDEARHRFEREVDLLGRLSHPGIARVFEAGVHGDGALAAPYFAMEFVEGARTLVDFTQECDTRDRIEIMAAVCDAVHHAHEEGVIHRDLKPANIIVGRDRQPRLIDFGIARTLEPTNTGATVQTMTGQLMGTLAWMSPEQLEGDPALVTPRTDVYALGVILYEVLTGTRPIDLEGRSVPDALELARHADPIPLAQREARFRGDLDTIVERAMARDPDRRYASAGALAEDLRRHLRGDPIIARADSTLYVAQRKVMRHRHAILISAAFIILLTVAAAVTWHLEHDRRALRAQVTTLVRDTPADIAPERLIDEVLRVLADADAIADPFAAEAPDVIRLETAGAWVDANTLDADVEARVRTALGFAWMRLEDWDTALTQLELAFRLNMAGAGTTADIARCELGLARARTNRYELAEAERLYRSSLDRRRGLASGPSLDVAESLNGLAGCLKRQGRFREARAMYGESLAMREAIPAPSHLIAASRNNIGDCFEQEGRFQDALPQFESALAVIATQQINVGFRLRALRHLALCRIASGELDGALDALAGTATAAAETFGAEHLNTLSARLDLARGLLFLGDRNRAAEELELIITTWDFDAVPSSARTLVASASALRAGIAVDRGALEPAEASVQAATSLIDGVLPPDHPQHRHLAILRARIDVLNGEDDTGRRLLESALDDLGGTLAPGHPLRQDTEIHLSELISPADALVRIERLRGEEPGVWFDPRLDVVQALAAGALGHPEGRALARAAMERMTAWYGVGHEETALARQKLRLLQPGESYP